MTKHSISLGSKPAGAALKRDTKALVHEYRSKSETFWAKAGLSGALKLFREAAKRVPAYADFLKKAGIKPGLVRTSADLERVPVTNKENYIRAYDPASRTMDGDFSRHRIIAASSGTSGSPTLWPRGAEQELAAARTHLALFQELYELDTYSTLLVIGFPMGIYVSGIATALPSFLASLAHPNLSILTASNNRESILSVIPNIAHNYEQIILCGHPFFIKEVLEDGKERGIDWSRPKTRTFFCSEGFTEEWRSHVSGLIPRSKPELDILSTYGSTELLLMGYETPETIIIRRGFEKDDTLSEKIFSTKSVPSLFQYDPRLRYIETVGRELVFTSPGTMPLIRYNLHDAGFITTTSRLMSALGPKFSAPAKKWTLPVVALHGRSDMTLVFNAVNIYPEQIHHVMNHVRFLDSCTGRFKLEKQYGEKMRTRFMVHIELRRDAAPSPELVRILETDIEAALLAENLEYRDAYAKLGKESMRPHVELRPHGDTEYFPQGLKPKYIVN